MKSIFAAIRWAIVPVIVGMFLATLAIQIWDRFAYEDTSTIFYSPKTDLTCLTATVHGKQVMWCEHGDLSSRKESAQ